MSPIHGVSCFWCGAEYSDDWMDDGDFTCIECGETVEVPTTEELEEPFRDVECPECGDSEHIAIEGDEFWCMSCGHRFPFLSV